MLLHRLGYASNSPVLSSLRWGCVEQRESHVARVSLVVGSSCFRSNLNRQVQSATPFVGCLLYPARCFCGRAGAIKLSTDTCE
jgi:hypothetical protein